MPKKNFILVTGGAGFVGTNLIKLLVKKTNYNIISLDDYSSGYKKNHLKNSKVKYLKGKTSNINSLIKNPSRIKSIFHFGEFARIYQSFLKMNECIDSNTIGTNAVFNFCLKHNIKLIYSATSASLGNKGNDKNLSPYAFTKSKNLELLENLKKWFNFKYEVIYFYNVYGPRQIKNHYMSAVIGIFENQYLNNEPLTVVSPGNQKRDFTHVYDIVEGFIEAGFNKRNTTRYGTFNLLFLILTHLLFHLLNTFLTSSLSFINLSGTFLNGCVCAYICTAISHSTDVPLPLVIVFPPKIFPYNTTGSVSCISTGAVI